MLQKSGGKPIAITLEQSKGPLIYALMFRPEVLLYPVNPKQFAKYRESFPGGDAKSDPSDARYIARMLCERISTLKPWLADDLQTRRLSNLSEQRRKLVNDQVSQRQQLKSHLKSYFPQLLDLCNEGSRLVLLLKMVQRWSDPRKLRRADRQLVDRVLRENGIHKQEQREAFISRMRDAKLLTSDAAIIEPLAMACSLLAKQITASRKTVKAFDEQIDKAIKAHPDGKLFTSLRKIARSWIRILFRVWKTGQQFDGDRYLKQLLKRNPGLANFLPK